MVKSMKKTKIKPKPQIKEKPDNKKILNKIILSLLFIAIIVTVIIIFKIKPSQNFDTSTTVSTLDTQYIIVKNKEGNKEFNVLRDDLARIVGTAKESVIRMLTEFKEDGYIDIIDGAITIKNKPKLESLMG